MCLTKDWIPSKGSRQKSSCVEALSLYLAKLNLCLMPYETKLSKNWTVWRVTQSRKLSGVIGHRPLSVCQRRMEIFASVVINHVSVNQVLLDNPYPLPYTEDIFAALGVQQD